MSVLVYLIITAALIILVSATSAILLLTWLAVSTQAPFVPLPRQILPQTIDTLNLDSESVLYDLGSGDGRVIFAAYAKHPEATYVGIEKNPLLTLIAQARKLLIGNPKNISFLCKDFFAADLTKANRAFTYLFPQAMDALLPKLEQELKRPARLVSADFVFRHKNPSAELPAEKPSRLVKKLLVYNWTAKQ